jgi:hypothetical protein
LRLLFLAGTFFPLRRASESPMAIACLRLFTFLPLRPLLRLPRLRLRIARSTSLEALREYFLAMIVLFLVGYLHSSYVVFRRLVTPRVDWNNSDPALFVPLWRSIARFGIAIL